MDRNNKAIVQKEEMQRDVQRNIHGRSLWYQNHVNAMKLEQIRSLDLSGIDDKAFREAVRKTVGE